MNETVHKNKSTILRDRITHMELEANQYSLPSISSCRTWWQISHFNSNYVWHAGVGFHFMIKNSEV